MLVKEIDRLLEKASKQELEALEKKRVVTLYRPGGGRTLFLLMSFARRFKENENGRFALISFSRESLERIEKALRANFPTSYKRFYYLELNTIFGFVKDFLRKNYKSFEPIPEESLKAELEKVVKAHTLEKGVYFNHRSVVESFLHVMKKAEAFYPLFVPDLLSMKSSLEVQKSLIDALFSKLPQREGEGLLSLLLNKYMELKAEQKYWSYFDQVVEALLTLDSKDRESSNRYDWIGVDSGEDLSMLEFLFLHNISNSLTLTMSKDLAVYSFRGANPESLLSFARELGYEVEEVKKSRRPLPRAFYSLKGISDKRLGTDKIKIYLVKSEDPVSAAISMIPSLKGKIGVLADNNFVVRRLEKEWKERRGVYDPGFGAVFEDILAVLEAFWLKDERFVRRAEKGMFFPSLRESLENAENYGIYIGAKHLLESHIKPILYQRNFFRYLPLADRISYLIEEFQKEGLSEEEMLSRVRAILSPSSYPEEESISFLTLHSSKGLEFDTVLYVPSSIKRKETKWEEWLNSLLPYSNERYSEEKSKDFLLLSRVKPAEGGGSLYIFVSSKNYYSWKEKFGSLAKTMKLPRVSVVSEEVSVSEEKEKVIREHFSSILKMETPISFSSLHTLKDSPFDYYILYVLKTVFGEEYRKSFSIGKSLHEELEMTFSYALNEGLKFPEDLKLLDMFALFRDRLEAMDSIVLRYYLSFYSFIRNVALLRGRTILGVEKEFEERRWGLRWKGRSDLVLGGRDVVVLDFKTTSPSWLERFEHAYKLQIELYREFLNADKGFVLYLKLIPEGSLDDLLQNFSSLSSNVAYFKGEGKVEEEVKVLRRVIERYAKDPKEFLKACVEDYERRKSKDDYLRESFSERVYEELKMYLNNP